MGSAAEYGIRGSEWYRWEPHIHAPGTVLADRYTDKDAWEQYLQALEAATPPLKAIGITDYCVTRSYEKVKAEKENGRLKGCDLLFPNIELRLDTGTVKGNFVNIHLLVSPVARPAPEAEAEPEAEPAEAPPILKQGDEGWNALVAQIADRIVKGDPGDRITTESISAEHNLSIADARAINSEASQAAARQMFPPDQPVHYVLPSFVGAPHVVPRPQEAAPAAEADLPEHPGLVVTSLQTGRTEHIQPPGTRPPGTRPPEPAPPPPAALPPAPEAAPEAASLLSAAPGYGDSNKVFTKDAADRARAVLRAKLGQLNAGFDPRSPRRA